MAYEFICERDFETTPARYAKYLKDTYANAQRTLSMPVQHWPRGTSHEISQAIIFECEEAICDLRMQFGLFDAEFKLVGYAEA